MIPTKFQVKGRFGSGEEAKNRSQDGGHGGHVDFLIEMITYF